MDGVQTWQKSWGWYSNNWSLGNPFLVTHSYKSPHCRNREVQVGTIIPVLPPVPDPHSRRPSCFLTPAITEKSTLFCSVLERTPRTCRLSHAEAGWAQQQGGDGRRKCNMSPAPGTACIQHTAISSETPDLGVFVMETYYNEREDKNPGLFSSREKLTKSSPESPCQKPQAPDTLTK